MLAPFLVELFDRSLLQGAVPTVFKSAYITPLLKQPDLDPAENKSYTAEIESVSALEDAGETRCPSTTQLSVRRRPNARPAVCPYRANHSTETALLKVLADILRAVNSGDLAVLALLDLSAAFDMVDHETLL